MFIYQSDSDVLIQRTLTAVIKKKHYIKEKIKDSTYVGILICSLSIKDLHERINRVKHLCKRANKKCYIFSVGRPNVAKLANFPEVMYFLSKYSLIYNKLSLTENYKVMAITAIPFHLPLMVFISLPFFVSNMLKSFCFTKN